MRSVSHVRCTTPTGLKRSCTVATTVSQDQQEMLLSHPHKNSAFCRSAFCDTCQAHSNFTTFLIATIKIPLAMVAGYARKFLHVKNFLVRGEDASCKLTFHTSRLHCFHSLCYVSMTFYLVKDRNRCRKVGNHTNFSPGYDFSCFSKESSEFGSTESRKDPTSVLAAVSGRQNHSAVCFEVAPLSFSESENRCSSQTELCSGLTL